MACCLVPRLPGMLLLLAGSVRPRHAVDVRCWRSSSFTPIAKGLVAPQPPMLVHDGRYVLHLLVLGLVVCACGVAALARLARPRWAVSALAVAGLVQIGGATVSAMDTYAAEVKNINDLQVRTGHWIAEHTSPDARVATNDIGAIAFFSRRFILDTEGLVTPDAIWDKRMWRIDRFFDRAQPDVVVIFPAWYPYLAQRPTGLTEVARHLGEDGDRRGETLVVYRHALDPSRQASGRHVLEQVKVGPTAQQLVVRAEGTRALRRQQRRRQLPGERTKQQEADAFALDKRRQRRDIRERAVRKRTRVAGVVEQPRVVGMERPAAGSSAR